jgi:sodium-dependent dicarboxylate transporter 2/3/5
MKQRLLLIGPLPALLMFVILSAGGWESAPAATAAITFLCALWWIFEPLPIPFTSMLPLALFPLFGILTPAQVAQSCGSPLILPLT